MVSLKLQKRLAASILKTGKRKIFLDPNEANEIGMANSRQAMKKLIKDGFVHEKAPVVHSKARHNAYLEAKSKGRHTGKFILFFKFTIFHSIYEYMYCNVHWIH